MDRPDRFAFGARHGDELRQGLPPSVGSDGGSTWFAGGGHVAVSEFPLKSAEFFLGVDLQPDNRESQTVLGAVWDRSAMIVEANTDGERSLTVTIRDEMGRSLVARAELSPSAAHRILITGDLRSASISVHELQPWARDPGRAVEVETAVTEPPEGVAAIAGGFRDERSHGERNAPGRIRRSNGRGVPE